MQTAGFRDNGGIWIQDTCQVEAVSKYGRLWDDHETSRASYQPNVQHCSHGKYTSSLGEQGDDPRTQTRGRPKNANKGTTQERKYPSWHKVDTSSDTHTPEHNGKGEYKMPVYTASFGDSAIGTCVYVILYMPRHPFAVGSFESLRWRERANLSRWQ